MTYGMTNERPTWQLQIRRQEDADPVGGGVLVTDRLVLTCAHVVAPGNASEAPTEPVYVHFQFVEGATPTAALVNPDGWMPEAPNGTGDFAILELQEPAPAGAVPASLRSSSDGIWDHRFRSYGYPKGHAASGVWSRGDMVGASGHERLQLETDSALGYMLEPGFSGSGVWDETAGAVVAIVVTRDLPREEGVDPRTGYGIPIEVIDRHWAKANPSLVSPLAVDDSRVGPESSTSPVTREERRETRTASSERALPASTGRIVQALSDTDSSVRYTAMSALRDRLTPELLPVIEPLLEDRDNYIRDLALDYYNQLTG